MLWEGLQEDSTQAAGINRSQYQTPLRGCKEKHRVPGLSVPGREEQAIYDSALFCTLARSFSNFLNAVDVVNIASGLAFHVLHAYHVFVM